MARYEWPAGPESGDDPGARGLHRAQVLPQANVRLDDGSLEPLPAVRTPRQRRRLVPKDFPGPGLHQWLPIGPSELIRGQAANRPPMSGRIADLQIEPTLGNRVYAATAGGGVWFSGDGGRSWMPLDEFVVSPNRHTITPMGSALACGAIHVRWGASTLGADDEVFVGTGEPKSFTNAPNPDPGGPHPGGNLVGIGILHATGPALGNPWLTDQGGDQLRGEAVARIVASPLDDEDLYAATNAGLWHRPAGGSWIRLTADQGFVDVAVTSHGAGDLRIWLADFAQVTMATVTPPVAAPVAFAAVTLAPAARIPTNRALAVAAPNTVWVLGRTAEPSSTDIAPAALWRIDASAATPAGAAVTGVPEALFGSPNDQSYYDIAIVAHPDSPERLFVGGSAVSVGGEWNAALYRLDITGTSANATMVGVGVHSDVHSIRMGALDSGGTHRSVWVGCDGGVFRSLTDGARETFLPCNVGLATLEAGFVACHPSNDGIVAAGMQDNGTCERIGDSVWTLTQFGDGGGVVYDPAAAHRFYRQYIRADWESSDGSGISPVHRRGDRGKTSSETIENEASKFYSGSAALAHGGRTHLLIGTDRPWYSGDWGTNWVTIPTSRDPRGSDQVDLALDVLGPANSNGVYTDDRCCSDVHGDNVTGGAALTTRLSVADAGTQVRVRAHCLYGGGLTALIGLLPATTSDPWTWALEDDQRFRLSASAAETTALVNGDSTRFMPTLRGNSSVTDTCPHKQTVSLHGSCYVTTSGGTTLAAGNPVVDTVWWFDGDGNWYPCGVRHTNARGRWLLPTERIIAPALAVVVDPTDADVVFVGTSVGVIRGVLSFETVAGSQVPVWDWEPMVNGLPETAVNDLSIFSDGTLRLLRAALHGRSVWEVDLATPATSVRTFLRVYPTDMRRRRPTPLTGAAVIGEGTVRFDCGPDIVVQTGAVVTEPGGPTEGALGMVDVRRHHPVVVDDAATTVDVMVHHRSPFAAAPSDIRVALLRRDLAAGETDPPIAGLWAALVAIAAGGTVPATLPSGWNAAGSQLLRNITAPADVRRPRAVRFTVDLTGHADGRVMLMAVVLSNDDQIAVEEAEKLAGGECTTLSELVTHSRHVAARLIEVD